MSKKENGWIKFLRVLIYSLSIMGLVVGIRLIKSEFASSEYANGIFAAKLRNGEIIFFTSLIVLSINIIWGMLRWFLRYSRENWSFGRTIGKLIGGGIWRTLVIIPLVLVSTILIAPQISRTIAANAKEPEFKAVSLHEREDRLEYILANYENMDKDEVVEELKELLECNFTFGLDASSNTTTAKAAPSLFTQNASAYSHTVTVLNKAKLSSEGHFVVFYTDTGDDKISDDTAEELADMLEQIIENYEEVFGLEYKYKRISNIPSSFASLVEKELNMRKVLKNSGLSTDTTETAMPVYVVQPYKESDGTLASYAGERWLNLLEQIALKVFSFAEEMAQLYDTSPSFPFFHITPDSASSNDLAIVSAHELGHHFVETYDYTDTNAPGTTNDFLDETIPNWLAINVLPNQPEDSVINRNHYSQNYLKKGCHNSKISDACTSFPGYPAVAFLENYYEIVPHGKEIIMEAARYGDALTYLYNRTDQAHYSKVMMQLAEKNLTHEYDDKLISKYWPSGLEMCADKLCERSFQIQPSATNAVYFFPEREQNKIIRFKGNDSVHASIIGFRRSDSKNEVIISNQEEIEFLITDDIIDKYEIVTVATANFGITGTSWYKISRTPKEVDDLITTMGNFDFSNLYSELRPGCYTINTDSIFDNLLNFVGLGSNVMSLLETVNPDELSGISEGYDRETGQLKEDIENAKAELSPYEISICANYINPSISFETAKNKLGELMGPNINIYNTSISETRMSVYASLDILTNTARAYALINDGTNSGLITVEVREK